MEGASAPATTATMDQQRHRVEEAVANVMHPPWGPLGRSITLGAVSTIARFVLHVLNKTEIHNHQRLLDAVENRPPGAGLITVANHTSMFDDPGVLSILMPWSWLWFEPWLNRVRWSLCAREVCFKNELLRQFFITGNTLPIKRGLGVHQPIVSVAAVALSQGRWVHLFPEGRINYDGKLGPLRWGVGKLVCEARQLAGGVDPVVLPFYHSGMAHVLPITLDKLGVGQRVTVEVGERLRLDDLTCKCGVGSMEEQQQVWARITERVRGALLELEARSPPNPDQSAVAPKNGYGQTPTGGAEGFAPS